MLRKSMTTGFVIFVAVFFTASVGASDLKTSLFKKADGILKTAEEKKARKYAPKTFKKGIKYYKKAEEDFAAQKGVEVVQKKLNKAIELFEKAVAHADEAANVFSSAIIARKDALNAEAPKYEEEIWKDAEEEFDEALVMYEEGEMPKTSKSKGKDATEMYREAELIAVKKIHLQSAREMIEKAKDERAKRYAPKTMEKAVLLLEKAEELLIRDRYNTKEAQKLAKEAEYEAKHCRRLNEAVRALKKEKKSYEDIFIEAEKPLGEIAKVVGVEARFDEKAVSEKILLAVKQLKAENEQLALTIKNSGADLSELALQRAEKDKIIRERDSKILELNQKIQILENQIKDLSSAKDKLTSKARKEQVRRAKAARVEAMFGPEEADVLQDVDENIIIRLYGLSFPKGMAVIEPKYFSLLTKVNDSISQFPNCRLVIEGHTDSTGSSAENLKLSGQRATAVKEYVQANTDIDGSRIKAVGYGEKRPVASNENKEGRAKNRRIDIIIKPSSLP